MVMLILLAAAAQPSPDALRLGRKLAEVGTLSTILPMMKKSEVEELINDHPELIRTTRRSFGPVRIASSRPDASGCSLQRAALMPSI